MRKLETGAGIVVIPLSLVETVERTLDASDATVLVVYPDKIDGADLAEVIREALKGV